MKIKLLPKFVISLVTLGVVLTLSISLFSYTSSKKYYENAYAERVLIGSKTIAEMLSEEDVKTIIAADGDQTETYREMYELMNKLKEDNEVTYLSLVVPDEDSVTFYIDTCVESMGDLPENQIPYASDILYTDAANGDDDLQNYHVIWDYYSKNEAPPMPLVTDNSYGYNYTAVCPILDENGKPIDIKPYEKSIATNMIEEFMLVCNETIAEKSFWQEMPFMYRSHQEPDEDKLEKMEQFLRGFGYYLRKKDGEIHPRELQKVLQKAEETDEERIITRMVLRSMMQARYTAENGGHFGLAAKYYCHFTSPIRRYPDLEIHRMIKKMLHGELDEKASAYYRRKMPDWAKHCSKQERVAEDAERDTDALKKVEFMEDKVGQIYEGIISGVTNWGIYVELPNTIEGMVALSQMDDDYYEFDEKKMLVFGKRTKKSYRLGDKVVVSVAKVDRMMGTIDFVFEKENEDFQE